MSSHFFRLLYAKDLAERWRYVCEDTIFELSIGVILADIHERYWVERVSSVRSAVLVHCIVAVTVVCDDDNLLVVFESYVHHFIYAFIDGFNRFLNCLVYTSMTHHVAVGKVQSDIVVFLCIKCFA